jgi:hypothetical protein
MPVTAKTAPAAKPKSKHQPGELENPVIDEILNKIVQLSTLSKATKLVMPEKR